MVACVLVGLPAPGGAAAENRPAVTLSRPEAAKGAEITVEGTGWRPKALLMLLVCGENMASGTNSCANAAGRAVTTDASGAFSKKLPVAPPPRPCPCVVHVATVTGDRATADAPLTITGHPVAPLPEPSGDGRLAVLASTRLEGSSGVLVWFGAPARRRLVLTVGNLGTAPVKDPVFQVGTAHGVYAPQWEERQWRGTVQPGRKALVELPVQLAAGAHGDYQVSVKYGGKVLAEQPWRVGRPWGVTLFWVLLAVVVPAALFRTAMAVVDRVRPQSRPSRPSRHSRPHPTRTVSLPWFAPDSAPSENRPTTKGHS
nr:neocarzinostatin apoprotein domain-containing protein [Streptomyces sp. CB03234]